MSSIGASASRPQVTFLSHVTRDFREHIIFRFYHGFYFLVLQMGYFNAATPVWGVEQSSFN
jgi:hypothetical protein